MIDLKSFLSTLKGTTISDLKKELAEKGKNAGVYTASVYEKDGSVLFIARNDTEKNLVVVLESPLFHEFEGKIETTGTVKYKICPMSHANAVILRKNFSFTNPVAHQGRAITIGLGDRLGLASPGHLRLIRDLDVFPVLAQQSIRELNLTGRNYEDVLDAASWAVFQEGYEKGFGADGDHLKTYDEVKYALSCGYTMITLDCSEQIDNSVPGLTDEQVDAKYRALPSEYTQALEKEYVGKTFTLPRGGKLTFGLPEFKRIVLIYSKAIKYTVQLYHDLLMTQDRKIDFEMSIDETLTPTSPQSHYFVASELIKGGVKVISLAPRFIGEFQKGIDYIGDLATFDREFVIHAEIADHFGYKLSIHSGSDKFSVFPTIGRETHGRYHLKTAGTNWLEAVRIIIDKDPSLYREIHKFALKHVDEAKKYYHVSTDIHAIPDIDTLSDDELPELMNKDNSRQLIHITYGLILQEKDASGNPVFRDRIYALLHKYEEDYYNGLIRHIGRHLKELGIM